LEIDEWRGVSKSDFKDMMALLTQMSEEISALNQKVEKLQPPKK
jgi:tyrosyl-tRNA synthetase